MRLLSALAPLALALLPLAPFAVASCSSTDDTASPASPASGRFRGLMSTPHETGVIDVTIGAPSTGASSTSNIHVLSNESSAVSGTISLVGVGGTVTISGSYDPDSGHLVLTGTTASGTYTLDGTSTSSGFTGTATSPSGVGRFSLENGTADGVSLYCGTFTGDGAGAWNLVLGSTLGTGIYCDGERCSGLIANVEGSTISLFDPADSSFQASGTIAVGEAHGTWALGESQGAWSGSTSACETPEVVDPGDAGEPDADAGPTREREDVATGLNNIVALALNASHAYFLSGTNASVSRCPLAGCKASAPELVVDSLSVPSSVSASDTAVFWTTGHRFIQTCSAASVPCTGTEVVDLGESSYPAHLFVAGGHLYWLREQGPTRLLQTCPVAGCGAGYPKAVYTSTSGDAIHNQAVGGLALTSTHAYVSLFTGGIARIALSGDETSTGAATSLASSGFGTGGVHSDGTSIWWPVQGDGNVYTCAAPDCASTSTLLSGQAEPGGVRANATHVYGFNRGTLSGENHVNGTSLVWRLPK